METINLKKWRDVSNYIDTGFYKPRLSTVEHIIQHGNYYPKHAFSKGQLASKSWLLDKLRFHLDADEEYIVAILGCWIGTLVEPLHRYFNLERIYGIDSDADAIEKTEKLNRDHVQDSWKYKGVVHDVDLLDCGEMSFTTEGELINIKPNVLVNTSCEHMSTLWYDSVDKDQLIVMQTNNSEEFDGHINPCYTAEEMQKKYPLSKTLYIGELITPAYTRYMQIGYK